MMETNIILGSFFTLLALTFLSVCIVRNPFKDHSIDSIFPLAALCISLFLAIFMFGGMQNFSPIGLWMLVLGLNSAIAIFVLGKPRLDRSVTFDDV